MADQIQTVALLVTHAGLQHHMGHGCIVHKNSFEEARNATDPLEVYVERLAAKVAVKVSSEIKDAVTPSAVKFGALSTVIMYSG